MVSLRHLEGAAGAVPVGAVRRAAAEAAIRQGANYETHDCSSGWNPCNLDIQLGIEMRTEMAQLFHPLKTTVFLHVTYDPSEAFAMADRIIVMNNGMIDQMDTPFACYLQPGTSMVAGLLGAGNCLMKALITSGSDEFCQVSLGGKKIDGAVF